MADLPTNPQPKCILGSCDKPVAQGLGLCPVFCGRTAACSLEHYIIARDKEDFVHPGLITPGMTTLKPDVQFVIPGINPTLPALISANGPLTLLLCHLMDTMRPTRLGKRRPLTSL